MKLHAAAVFGMGTATEHIRHFVKYLCHEKLLHAWLLHGKEEEKLQSVGRN
jgi:hypothetical protein